MALRKTDCALLTNGTAVDFRPTNTFTNVPFCSQTYPRQQGTGAMCPATCDLP